MKVCFLIPMFGRHNAVSLCLTAMKRIFFQWAGFGITTRVVVIVSNKEDQAFAERFDVDVCWYSNEQIGRKFNAGLDYAFKGADFDYLCVLGSDDIASTNAIHWYLPYLHDKLPFFGINNPSLINSTTGEAVYFRYKIQSGALRMHRHDALHDVAWNRDEQRYILWPDELGFGMDMKSEDKILRAGHICHDATPRTGCPLILDIKDEDSLSSWKNLVDSGLRRMDREIVLNLFPESKKMIDRGPM